MDYELIFIIVSVLITGGLAINAHISNKAKESELNQKTEKIVELQNHLNEKSERLITVQEELLKYTTGSESFGIVIIIKISKNDGGYYYNFYFENKSKYPLYDVKITQLDRSLINLEDIKKRNGVTILDDFEHYKNYDIGTIGGEGGGLTFGPVFEIKPNIINDFVFSINTRNVNYSQQLKFIEINKELLSATKLNSIVTGKNQKVKIYIDEADKDFPGAIDGKIKWDNTDKKE